MRVPGRSRAAARIAPLLAAAALAASALAACGDGGRPLGRVDRLDCRFVPSGNTTFLNVWSDDPDEARRMIEESGLGHCAS